MPTKPTPGTYKRCFVHGCRKQVFAAGKCQKHDLDSRMTAASDRVWEAKQNVIRIARTWATMPPGNERDSMLLEVVEGLNFSYEELAKVEKEGNKCPPNPE